MKTKAVVKAIQEHNGAIHLCIVFAGYHREFKISKKTAIQQIRFCDDNTVFFDKSASTNVLHLFSE